MHIPGNSVCFMEKRRPDAAAGTWGTSTPVIDRGVQESSDRRAWDGTLLWRYTYNSPPFACTTMWSLCRTGNVDHCLGAEDPRRSRSDGARHGGSQLFLGLAGPYPGGRTDQREHGDVVWEWHAWDHLVQDRDPNPPNFGVTRHPERIRCSVIMTQGNQGLDAPRWIMRTWTERSARFNEIWVTITRHQHP